MRAWCDFLSNDKTSFDHFDSRHDSFKNVIENLSCFIGLLATFGHWAEVVAQRLSLGDKAVGLTHSELFPTGKQCP